MHILTRWSFRTVRANRSRTITVILAVVGFFALWVCAAFVAEAAVHSADMGGVGIGVSVIDITSDYLFRAMVDFLFVGLSLVMLAILFSIFSVTANEYLQDFRILTSSGATKRQIFRTLLFRSILLDLAGAAVGIAFGLFTALFSLGVQAIRETAAEPGNAASQLFSIGTERFREELPRFVQDPRVLVMLSVGLLLVPCMMALATALAFRRKRKKAPPRAPKRGMFRRTFTQRVFGVGGTLGKLSSKTNLPSRITFTIAFAVCLTVPALLDNTLLLFAQSRSLREDFDLTLDCYNYSTDASLSGSDVLDELLLQNADRLNIKNSASYLEQRDWYSSYMLLDSDWIAEPVPEGSVGQPFEKDGKSVRLCKGGVYYGFLDNASFERYAAENGIETGTDGAIFANGMHPENANTDILSLMTFDPEQDVTVHFVPYAFLHYSADEFTQTGTFSKPILHASDAEFLRAADPVSVTKSFRILGVTQALPFDMENYYSILIFPERMYGTFTQTLSGVDISPDYPMTLRSQKRYFYTLQNPAADAKVFSDVIRLDPRLDADEKLFGMGSRSISEREEQTGEPDPVLATVFITDLFSVRDKLNVFQSMIPAMRTILLATSGWILFVGILNTAHMNRQTRRRQKAILESIGMDGRQRMGMLLYESTRYALCSGTLGFLGFLVLFRLSWKSIQQLLFREGLLVEGTRTTGYYQKELFYFDEKWGNFPLAFAEAFARTWWIFAGGAVLIFVLMIVVDKYIERRSRTEDLIQILTDDSTDDNGSV